jgi:hypothetical protein
MPPDEDMNALFNINTNHFLDLFPSDDGVVSLTELNFNYVNDLLQGW